MGVERRLSTTWTRIMVADGGAGAMVSAASTTCARWTGSAKASRMSASTPLAAV